MSITSNRIRPLAVKSYQGNPFQGSGHTQAGHASRFGAVKSADVIRFSAYTQPKKVFDLRHPPEGYEVSRASADDVKEVVDFIEHVFGDVENKPVYQQNFRDYLRDGAYTYAIRDTKSPKKPLIATATLKSDGFIFSVCVDKKHEGKGIATAMMQGLVEQGKEMGLKRLYLSVKKDNPAAIRAYEKAGFMPAGDLEDGMQCMERRIKPHPLYQRLFRRIKAGITWLLAQLQKWLSPILAPQRKPQELPV